MMNWKKTVCVGMMVVLGAAVSSGAFVGCGGGGADVQTQSVSTTLGQELQDLDKAYKDGIITEKEYKEAKKTILKRYKK
jgi:hypothetical protein